MNVQEFIKEKKHPLMVIALMLVLIGGIFMFQKNGAVTATETLPDTQAAQVSTGYEPLAPLPGQQSIGTADTLGYLQAIINFSIGIAIILAVLMIVIGGIQYMASDAFTSKETAKEQITMAVWGLVIALGGYLLLYTINPDLITFRLPSGVEADIKTLDLSIKTAQQILEGAKTDGEQRVAGEDLLGRSQDVLKINYFPQGSGKYFEAVIIGNATNKEIAVAAAACKKLDGAFEQSYIESVKNFLATTYVCKSK